ncbi:MAG: hypothetical protein ACRC4L_00090 [Mycoplasma sp.]
MIQYKEEQLKTNKKEIEKFTQQCFYNDEEKEEIKRVYKDLAKM